jgi:hypothetical protein
MSTVLNLLSEESTKFLTSVGSWRSSSLNALSITRGKIRTESNSSSLRIYVSSGTTASAIASTEQFPDAYHDWPMRAFAWVNCDKSKDVTIYFTYVSGGASTTVSSTTSVIADNWTLLSVQQDLVPHDATDLIVRVIASGLTVGDSLYVSRPAVMSPWAAAQSIAGGEIWLRLPQYLQSTDKNQTDPDVPLFRFIETLFDTANNIDLTWQNFRWIPPEDNDGSIKESGLVSPNASLPPALVWMAQVIGSNLLDPTASYTPWIFLDNDNNPGTSITWAQWIAAIDAKDGSVDGVATWDEIQNYSPAVFDLTSSFTEQVNGAFYGYKAGTTASIIAAAKTVNNVNTVTVTPFDVVSDPFHIRVSILSSEGGNAIDVARALVDTTPAGYQITVASV